MRYFPTLLKFIFFFFFFPIPSHSRNSYRTLAWVSPFRHLIKIPSAFRLTDRTLSHGPFLSPINRPKKKSMFSSVIDIFIFNICSFHFRIRRCLGAMRAVQVLETGSLYLAILVLVIVIEEVLSLMMVMYRCIPRADVKGPMLLTLPGKCGPVLWYSSGKESRINNLSFIVKSTNAAPSWIKGSSLFKLLTLRNECKFKSNRVAEGALLSN